MAFESRKALGRSLTEYPLCACTVVDILQVVITQPPVFFKGAVTQAAARRSGRYSLGAQRDAKRPRSSASGFGAAAKARRWR